MPFVENVTALAHVPVYQNTLAIPTLVVDQNVYKTLNVIKQERVSTINVLTHALVSVLRMRVSCARPISSHLSLANRSVKICANLILLFIHFSNLVCTVRNHAPNCFCDNGFTGNPTISCSRIEISKCPKRFESNIEINRFLH